MHCTVSVLNLNNLFELEQGFLNGVALNPNCASIFEIERIQRKKLNSEMIGLFWNLFPSKKALKSISSQTPKTFTSLKTIIQYRFPLEFV